MLPDKIAEPMWLLLVFSLLIFLIWRKKTRANLRISSASIVSFSGGRVFLSRFISFAKSVLWLVLFAAVILIISRPMQLAQSSWQEKEVRKFSLCVDTSISMTGEGIKRIKEITDDFVQKRQGDWIAITAFSGSSGMEGGAGIVRTLTPNIHLARESIKMLESQMFGGFTAIGEGIWVSALAVVEDELEYLRKERKYIFDLTKLRQAVKNKDSVYMDFFSRTIGQKKNRVIILFTDGIYNTGIHPLLSAELVKRMGIKMYIVAIRPSSATGVGQEEGQRRKREIIDAALSTGGRYYEGESYDEVKKFFEEINIVETDKVFVREAEVFKDKYAYYALMGLWLYFFLSMLANIWLKIP